MAEFSPATVRTYLNEGVPLSIATNWSTRHGVIANVLQEDFGVALDLLAEGACPVDSRSLIRVGDWGHCLDCCRHYRTYVIDDVQVIDFEECPTALGRGHLCPAIEVELVG